MSTEVMRRVTDLYMKCSFDLRDEQQRKRGGFAASDCCGMSATSAVVMENGDRHWRCPDHEGRVRPGIAGRVVFEVPVQL